MIIDWEFLTKDFLTIGIGVIVFQALINLYFNRKLEKYRKEISRELEDYKKELNIIINRDNSMFEKRIQIIDELYGKIVKLKYSLLSLSNPIKLIVNSFDEEERIRIDNVFKDFIDLQRFYLLKKIYFSNEVCLKIDEIISIANKTQWHFSEPIRMKNLGIEKQEVDFYSKSVEIRDEIENRLEPIQTDLENEFKLFFQIDKK